MLTPFELTMRWKPAIQSMAAGDAVFVHRQPTNTFPSHDVAHLIVAAAGTLPWRPVGTPDEIRVVEFNAITFEHLCDRALRGFENPLESALEHSRDLVEREYAPFPLDYAEALERWTDGIDVEAAVRLVPIYFRMRAWETVHPEFMTGTYACRFRSDAAPEVGQFREAAVVLERCLDRLTCGCGCSSC